LATVAEVRIKASGGAAAAKQLDQVGKSTDVLTRNQTRLGQASASAGRQFSAQANGLGGLVGAYAGAAANVFAITAAFFALRRAAEFEQIISGTNALAATIGANGTALVQSVQEITKSQLSLLDTVQQVNLALVSGFNTSQIEELSDVSLRASKALGRNLGDAFTRIVRGAAKLEPELLDELGIFTRIDPAVRKYADSIGVSVSSLTNFERRQAFVNAVIEEGTTKYRDVDTTTKTAAESLQALAAAVVDTGLKFGAALSNFIAPFADFISEDANNTIALFGVLARVVGSTAIVALTAGVEKATTSIQAFATSTAASINSLSRGFTAASKASAEFAQSTATLTRFGTAAEQTIKAKARATLDDIKNNRLNTKAEIELAKATLQEAAAVETAFRARSKSLPNRIAARNAARSLTQQIQLLTVAESQATVAAGILSTGLKGLAAAASVAGFAISRVLGFVTTLITVASLLQLFGDAVAQFFGFEDLISVFTPVIEFFNDLIAKLNLAKAGIEGFASTIDKDLRGAAATFGVIGKEADKAIKTATDTLQGYARFLAGDRNRRDLANQFERLKNEASAAGAVLRTLVSEIEQLGAGLSGGVAGLIGIEVLSFQSGIAIQKFIDLVKASNDLNSSLGLAINQTGGLVVKIGEFEATLTTVENGVVNFVKGFETAGSILAAFAQSATQFAKDYAAGLLTAERAAAAVAAQTGIIAQLQADADKQRQLGNIAEAERLEEAKLELQIVRNINQAYAQQITALEKVAKQFDKIYGKTGEKISILGEAGQIKETINGIEFVLTKREQLAQQATRLTNRIKEANQLEQSGSAIQTDLINKRKKQIDAIASIQRLQQLSLGDADKERELALELQLAKNALASTEEKINAQNSELIPKLQQRQRDEEAILLIKQQLLTVIEKEVNALERQQRQAVIKLIELNNTLANVQEKRQLNALKAQLKIVERINKFNQTLLKSAGISTEQAELAAAVQEGQLTIGLAKSERDASIARAQRQEKLELAKLENDKKTFAANFSIQKTQIDATVNLIRALNLNTDSSNRLLAQAGGQPVPQGEQGRLVVDFLTTLPGDLEKLGKDIETLTTQSFELRKQQIAEELKLRTEAAGQAFSITKLNETLELAEKRFAANSTVKLFKAVNESFRNDLAKGVDDFFQSIADGTLTLDSFKEGFKQFLFDTFENIRKAVLQETLIKPLQDKATNFLAGAFGLDSIREQSIESAIESVAGGNALRVISVGEQAMVNASVAQIEEESKSFVDNLSNGFSMVKEKSFDFFSNVGEQFSALGNTAKGVFDGVLKSIGGEGGILQSIGGLFGGGGAGGSGGGFFSTLFSSFGFGASASGGFVPSSAVQRLAAGGMARDRVPTLLEPGEFVMKRSSANSIGAPALNQMNATGKAGGNVVVNIQNQGTPQDATASGPRFDGEKFVIDIVTRDLRNNGPIRKSLRSGGAG